ncbi:MAG: TetR/AcrR family transcriptional regulator [Anaerolineales bacterium]|nr:TetR/AcrR family transcriptional regulator [Anaerolineales bacterium]MCX7754699.1 TetR/AcrR family transcriptional regulator [Anaerolineales bacterium]MDW8278894.1 TetR/AcrR family transcriptional regulator [Anaerolineales bacterium]
MQARSEETRTHILEAALRRFASVGYNAASVEDICTAAGVSKGAFYHHFPSKQALFLALLNDWLATLDAGFEAARKANVPETLLAFTEMLPAIFAAADGRLTMFLEFWLQASRDEAVWQASIAPYERYQQFFTALVEQGQAEGSLRADVEASSAARAIVGLAVGLLLQALLNPQANWERTAQESMEILLNGLMHKRTTT